LAAACTQHTAFILLYNFLIAKFTTFSTFATDFLYAFLNIPVAKRKCVSGFVQHDVDCDTSVFRIQENETVNIVIRHL
jgi:hypothetical protein